MTRNAALASSRLSESRRSGRASTVGRARAEGLAAAPGRGRLAGWPNVRLPIQIAAFRAQGRLRQLGARSGPPDFNALVVLIGLLYAP